MSTKKNTHYPLLLLSLVQHSRVSTSPLCSKDSVSGCAIINSGVAMGTAQLCGLASCLGLWLNKQVKSADKDACWSLQPHLHSQLPSALQHSASWSGLASPSAVLRVCSAPVIRGKSRRHCDGKTVPVIRQHNVNNKGVPSKQTGSWQEAVDPTIWFISASKLLHCHPGHELRWDSAGQNAQVPKQAAETAEVQFKD